ncbi:MAG: tetratricopeptide repeat protein, partial [Acidobacteriota bacterium]
MNAPLPPHSPRRSRTRTTSGRGARLLLLAALLLPVAWPAAADDADALRALEQQAMERLASDDLTTAAALYQQLAARQTTPRAQARALVEAAWIEHLDGRGDDATRTLVEALLRVPDWPPPGDDRDPAFRDRFFDAQATAVTARDDRRRARIQAAAEALRRRDTATARAELDALLADHPDDPHGLYNQAQADRLDGDDEAAITGLERLLAIAGARPEAVPEDLRDAARADLGALLNRMRRFEEARDALEQATARQPDNVEAWAQLARSRRMLGDLAGADDALARASALAPDNRTLQRQRGRLALDAGDAASALALLAPLRDAGADDALLLHDLGRAHRLAGDRPAALALFRAAEAADPDHAAGVAALAAVDQAALHRAAGDHAASGDAAARALRHDPEQINGWVYRGLAAQRGGSAETARESFENARRIDPTRADVHANLGLVYHALGRRDDAVAALEQALAINPDLSGVRDNLDLVRS